MVKPSAKSVWIVLGILELIILLGALVYNITNGDEAVGAYVFLYPVAFAFLVLIGTAVFVLGMVVFRLVSPKQPVAQKKDMLHRILVVVAVLAGLAALAYGSDFLIKQ